MNIYYDDDSPGICSLCELSVNIYVGSKHLFALIHTGNISLLYSSTEFY